MTPRILLSTVVLLLVLVYPKAAEARIGSSVWYAGQREPDSDKCLIFPPWQQRYGTTASLLFPGGVDRRLPPRGMCVLRDGIFGLDKLNDVNLPTYCPGRPSLRVSTYGSLRFLEEGATGGSAYPLVRVCTQSEIREHLQRTW